MGCSDAWIQLWFKVFDSSAWPSMVSNKAAAWQIFWKHQISKCHGWHSIYKEWKSHEKCSSLHSTGIIAWLYGCIKDEWKMYGWSMHRRCVIYLWHFIRKIDKRHTNFFLCGFSIASARTTTWSFQHFGSRTENSIEGSFSFCWKSPFKVYGTRYSNILQW